MKRFLLVSSIGLSIGLLVGCDASATPGDAGHPLKQVASCEVGAQLAGADYDIRKSKFAFGSTPVKTVDGTLTRWTGTQGVLAVQASGSTLGVMNAGAEETNVADWSADTDAPEEHVRSYFVGMGVAECQIEDPSILGGSLGNTASLIRAVDGIEIVGSLAYARFNSHDLTTSEGFYWPTISAKIVAQARAFREQLADTAALAAFKAKLPTNAQGAGVVAIHHSTDMPTESFEAVATYDVISGRSQFSFTRDGQMVTPPQ